LLKSNTELILKLSKDLGQPPYLTFEKVC